MAELINYESNADFLSNAKFSENYGSKEMRMAYAIADILTVYGIGGGSGGGGLTQSQVQAAIESASNLDSLEGLITTTNNLLANSGTTNTDGSFSLNGTAQDILPANVSRKEIIIQNKSTTEDVYLRAGNTATVGLSITVSPLATQAFTGFLAQQAISGITLGSSVNVYYQAIS